MTTFSEKPTDTRSMSDLLKLVDAFDDAWHAGESPRIETYLERFPSSRSKSLLAELIAIEWEHRLKRKQSFGWLDYAKRFPENADWLERHWREVMASLRSGTPTDRDAGSSRTKSHQPGIDESSRFRIEGLWARGGIGEVLLAWDRTLKRHVAVKIIQAELASNEEVRRRFRLEAEVIGRLEHPGVIPIHCFGYFANGEPFYAMRLVKDGETMESRIARAVEDSRLSVEQTIPDGSWDRNTNRFLANDSRSTKELPDSEKSVVSEFAGDAPNRLQIAKKTEPLKTYAQKATETRSLLERFLMLADTVAFAHEQGVIHRDIKPANVILGPYGETFLVDWGLALVDKSCGVLSGEDQSVFGTFSDKTFEFHFYQPGRFLGTPAYCSPEQAIGLPCNRSCDIYCLGATLYEIMVGRPPRSGYELPNDLIAAARKNSFPPPRQVLRSLDKAMEAIILKAMATKPRNRYASARELGEDVRRWMADEPVLAWREPITRRLSRTIRRHRKAATAAALIALLALMIRLNT